LKKSQQNFKEEINIFDTKANKDMLAKATGG